MFLRIWAWTWTWTWTFSFQPDLDLNAVDLDSDLRVVDLDLDLAIGGLVTSLNLLDYMLVDVHLGWWSVRTAVVNSTRSVLFTWNRSGRMSLSVPDVWRRMASNDEITSTPLNVRVIALHRLFN